MASEVSSRAQMTRNALHHYHVFDRVAPVVSSFLNWHLQDFHSFRAIWDLATAVQKVETYSVCLKKAI